MEKSSDFGLRYTHAPPTVELRMLETEAAAEYACRAVQLTTDQVQCDALYDHVQYRHHELSTFPLLHRHLNLCTQSTQQTRVKPEVNSSAPGCS